MATDEPNLSEEYCSRSDMALLRRAARERWPIPEEKRARLVAIAIRIAESSVRSDGGSNDRDRLAALKVLEAFDRANMEQERRADPTISDRIRIEVVYADPEPTDDGRADPPDAAATSPGPSQDS